MYIENKDKPITLYPECKDFDAFKNAITELCHIDMIHGQTSLRASGKITKEQMSNAMKLKCHGFIHAAATAAGAAGAGLAQAVGSDNAVIVPIQITMLTTMGKQVFDLDITEAGAKSIIASAGASIAGRTASQFLIGWIPGVGNAINTATAAGITELIGWIAASDFYRRWLQDQNKGRLAGMKIGYEEASKEYEKKLRAQADAFLNQRKNIELMSAEYENLLDEYEKHIKKLESENASLVRLLELERELNAIMKLKKGL